MSHFGLVAAHRLRALDPEAALELAAELRNAVTPAAAVVQGIHDRIEAFDLNAPKSVKDAFDMLDDTRGIHDTVNHIVQLAKILGGE